MDPHILPHITHTHTHGRVDTGDIFLLLTRLNDDWGWGRSQRTDESGLIPLAIMEDVVSMEDMVFVASCLLTIEQQCVH